MVGKLIGQYRIAGIIGAGAMGTVYIGEHTLIPRRAAIKILRPELSRRRDIVERFFTEARAAAAINHAGIVQVFDFGFASDGAAYLVMELLEGRSLDAWLRNNGPMATLAALRVIRQVASSIAAAHEAGILHRDLKPDNIFLADDPAVPGGLRAKVLDFGIARLGESFAATTTAVGTVMGTPMYMASEQFDGAADERSDIYALGCVLFEALVGKPPFHEYTIAQLISSHVRSELKPPSSQQPSVPAEVDALVLRCLETDPAGRFPSMAELAGAIDAVLGARPAAELAGDGKAVSVVAPAGNAMEVPAPAGAPAQARRQEGEALPKGAAPAPAASQGAAPGAASPKGAAPAPPASPAPPPISFLEGVHLPSLFPDDIEPPRDELAAVFEAAVPTGFRDLSSYVVEFFRELFQSASSLEGRLIKLGAPVIRDLESRAHYVLFLNDVENDAAAPFGQIGARAFRAQVDPLANRLAALGAPAGSVVITVLAAPQLGQGARETIFALRKERNLFVVPIAASEIRRACEAGNTRLLLINRIADLHTVSDPFAIFDGFTDPTCWVGFSAEVADLVKYIIEGGKIVSVAGPPGSGKTSMVAMAEYGCDTSNVARQFVRLQCRELPDHDPRRLIQEIGARIRKLRGDPPGAPEAALPAVPAPAEPPNLRTDILALGGRSVPRTLPGVLPRRARQETGLAKRHQLVIVLEDADWLIRLASSSEPDAEQRRRAYELWGGLAQLCSSGGHTVIVTSIRDFQVMDQVPLESPVTVSRVPMRALSRRDSDHLVTSLGELVGFRPTRRAFARLHHESGGNVYALRLLCSDVIRATREQPDYSPLASLTVTPKLVARAADHIAATGSTFRSHVSVWLDDAEKTVLQYVAKERPRTPQGIRRALEANAAPDQIAKALDGLELMGIVDHRRGHHRVCIPLFERWINNHLDAPRSRRYAIQQQRLSRIAIGFTCTALLFGGYWTWLRSTRSTRAGTVEPCRFELDYPDRIGLDETVEIFVYQDCKVAKQHELAVEWVRSSLSTPVITTDCTATSRFCTTTVKTIAGKQAHDRYQVQLQVDGQPVTSAEIEKDRFAAIRSIGEKSVPAISFIPLILALVFSFHRETKRYVAQLFGRGDGSPSVLPEEASKG